MRALWRLRVLLVSVDYAAAYAAWRAACERVQLALATGLDVYGPALARERAARALEAVQR